MKKILAWFLVILSVVAIGSSTAFAADDFSAVLAQFPDSYKASLTQLHKLHPNWHFTAVNVGKNFSVCLNAEHNCKAKLNLVEVGSASDAKACQKNCANASYHTVVDGVYRCASYDYIAECMDPTNFLRESLIFQFESLAAKAYYTQDKLESALSATSSFMANKTYRTSSKTYYYSQIILDACKQNEVDALFIISRITNEIGSASPAKLALGYSYEYEKGKTKTVYNFFNIGGNVSASAKYAYNHGWTNPKAALEGGIKFIAQNYVKAGQDTNYFQKFQVNPSCSYGFYEHQYMQGTDAVINEAGYTYNNYAKLGIIDKEHIFKIPVYNKLESVNYEAQDLCFKNASLSEKYAFVNSQVSTSLAVRSEASTASGYVKCRIKRSTLLLVSGKSGAWYKVKVLTGDDAGTTGYSHSDYISLAQKIQVPKDSKLTLSPKLRSSTCKYAAAYAAVSGAVSVDKNGVATGKKIGSVVFKATSSAGNVGFLELEGIGLIDAPVFSVTGGVKQASISWKAVSDAKQYRVYSYNTESGKYTLLTKTTALSYTHSSLTPGTVYTYLVRAVDVNGYCSAYTLKSNKAAITRSATPKLTLSANSDTVTVSWAKAKGAEKYGVWSYNSSTDKYTKLGNTTAATYKWSSLAANKSYTLLVRSYNESGWSAYSKSDRASITTAPAAPKASASGANKQITLGWKKCTGASVYRIYRYDSAQNSYKRVGETAALSYTLKNLSVGSSYTYLVRAFNKSGSGSSYTAANRVQAVTRSAKPAVKCSAGSSTVTLSWAKVKGAEKYGVWRYNSATKKYTKLGNTSTLSYKISALSPNTSYTYLVRSYNESGWSGYSRADNKSAKTAPAKPKLTAAPGEQGVSLRWSKCAGASSYRVYSFDTDSGKYTRLSTVKTTAFTDTAPGENPIYLVRAFNSAGSGSDYGEADRVRVVTSENL